MKTTGDPRHRQRLGHGPRRTRAGLVALLATLALGAVAACQAPPNYPGSPGSTTTDDGGSAASWSDAVFPECGDWLCVA